MKGKKIILLLMGFTLIFSSCAKNTLDWMHEDGSSSGADLVKEADAYLNDGQNARALEYYEKAIPQVDGENRVRAILGAISAKYNLVFGGSGVFFLETAGMIPKLVAAANDVTLESLLDPAIWQEIKFAYDYIKADGRKYFKMIQSYVGEEFESFKTSATYLELMGAVADIAIAMNDFGISINGLDPTKLTLPKLDSIFKSIVSAVGGIPDKIRVVGFGLGGLQVVLRFTKWPDQFPGPNYEYGYSYNSVWGALRSNALSYAWVDANSDWIPDSPNGGLNSNIDGDDGSNTEFWYDSVNQEYVFYSDTKADSKLLIDLIRANTSDVVSSVQDQILKAVFSTFFK